MAVHKATRSNPSAQPQPKHPRAAAPTPTRQVKSQLFETLRHLNRGFGVALAAFDRLQRLDRLQKPGIFPQDCLHDYRNRTEALRAQANRDLLRLFASREEQDAERFGQLSPNVPAQTSPITAVADEGRSASPFIALSCSRASRPSPLKRDWVSRWLNRT